MPDDTIIEVYNDRHNIVYHGKAGQTSLIVGKSPVTNIVKDKSGTYIINGITEPLNSSRKNRRDYAKRNCLNSGRKSVLRDVGSLNCAVENARVEQTDQGTFVVRGDSDRFGPDAILYEDYDRSKAEAYLEKINVLNPAEESDSDTTFRYKGYIISGSDVSGYVVISPYGKYSPNVFKTIEEAKASVDEDNAYRFGKK